VKGLERSGESFRGKVLPQRSTVNHQPAGGRFCTSKGYLPRNARRNLVKRRKGNSKVEVDRGRLYRVEGFKAVQRQAPRTT